jgi:hypothetical protein
MQQKTCQGERQGAWKIGAPPDDMDGDMKTIIAFAALVLFAAVALATPMPTHSVVLEIVFPDKKTDRAMPYWFIAARGYDI